MSSPKHFSTCRVALTSTALVKSLAVSIKSYNHGALVRGAFGRLDATATTGTYYIHLLDAATLPSDGAVTHLIHPQKLIHANGTDSLFDIDLKDEFIKSTNGIVLVGSTTEFTLTLISTAWIAATILYK